MTAKTMTETRRWAISIVITGVVAACASYIVPTMSSGYAAMHRLDLHETEQAGALEAIKADHAAALKTIETRLTSICTYHSNFRGDMKDMRAEHKEEFEKVRQEQKELRDIVVRGSVIPDSTP